MTQISEHLRALGIAEDYGTDPFRPRYDEPTELVDVEVNIVGRMQQLIASTAKDWLTMKGAALDDRVELLLVSGFRSVSHQAELLKQKLSSGQHIEAILAVSAAPGYSQHHTGQTVDLAARGARPLTEEFENTEAFEWLQFNAGRFGFRMPYGRNNSFGFAYEPWHWTQLAD